MSSSTGPGGSDPEEMEENGVSHEHAGENDAPKEHLKPPDEENEAENADATPASPSAKKKRKPKKKAKKPVTLPSIAAVEESLPWQVAYSQKLGRHAIAKRDIEPGELVLAEAPVATVARLQYSRSSCHMCARELPELAASGAAAAPYKRYCTMACAAADTRAGLTQAIHSKIPRLSAEAETDPLLLHFIVELDCQRATSVPPVKPLLTQEHGWTLEVAVPAHGAEDKPAAAAAADRSKGAASGGQEAGGAADIRLEVNGSQSAAGDPTRSGDEAASSASLNEGSAVNGASAMGKQHDYKEAPVTPDSAGQKKEEVVPVRCGLDDVSALTAHWEGFPALWRASVKRGCDQLRQAIIDDGAYTPGTLQQFLDLAAIINSNSHGLGAANSNNTDRGLGLFPTLSMLNHSCRPNCTFASTGGLMKVRAVRPIKAGEQLTVSYTNHTEPRKVRAQDLFSTKHFKCACERCSEPLESSVDRYLEAVTCAAVALASAGGANKCKGYLLERRTDNLLDGEFWHCSECGRDVRPHSVPVPAAEGKKSLGDRNAGPQDIADEFKTLWSKGMAAMRFKGTAAARPVLEHLLARTEGVLHPMHVTIIDSYMPLVNCCRSAGDTPAAIKYLSQLITCLDAILGSVSVELGNLNELLGRLYAERANSAPGPIQARAKKQAREAWQRALSIWNICLGPDSERCSDLASRLRLLR